MRYLNYILLGIGGLVAVLAVAFFLFDTAEPEAVQPQAETVTTVPSTTGDASAVTTVVAT